MQTFYGSFRALEISFLSYLRLNKPGPRRPVLVICPSGRTAEYLRRKFTQQEGIVSNLFFATLGQLMAHLDQENETAVLPLLPGDMLHDYILKNLLLQPHLARYPVSRGFITALKSSLRDLADSLAQADVLEEHAQTLTDPMLTADQAHWQWLVEVYREYQQKMEQIPGYRSYQNYFEGVCAQAEKSAWLASFSEIIWYGFYEFTGRQLELFDILRRHYPLRVFWPYMQGPAFAFGRKFFEANIMGASSSLTALPEEQSTAAGETLNCLFTPDRASSSPTTVQVISAPDVAGELFFVAKEIIRLTEETNLSFADIAVTARNMEEYATLLPEVFAQNAIAWQAQFPVPFNARPLGVFILNLLLLVRGGFDREDLLAVVNSPYFKQPNTWRYLIEESLAKRDFSQWSDLVRPSLSFYDPAFLDWLSRTKEQIEQLEVSRPWSQLQEAVLAFLQENVCTEGFSAEEQLLWDRVQETINSFSRYCMAAEKAREGEFLDELVAALKTIPSHQVYDMPGGVTVADVASLRGQRFKAVFILGMNEKTFPQIIREDPILKDYYRRVLRDQLGFWINQKMERFEEERLLFYCTAEAAEEQLYLSFLRKDREGKPLILSSYLSEFARAARIDLQSETLQRVSAHVTQRMAGVPLTHLHAKEVSVWLACHRAPEADFQAAHLLDEDVQRSLQACRQIAALGKPTKYDGQIVSGEEIFRQQNAKGFSPSALQDLARCPMKYFLSRGVGLREQEQMLSRSELAPNLRGNMYHQVLMDYYQSLYEQGLTGQLFDSALQQQVEKVLQEHYTPGHYREFGIYPVIWELILQEIHDKLVDFVCKDAAELKGYIPSIFETCFENYYAPSAAVRIKLKGVIDRIDIDPQRHTFRIIDYKSGRHGGKDLAVDMFKQVILQPYLYLLMAQHTPDTKDLTPDGAALLTIQKGYGKQELSQAGFETVKDRASQFFVLLTRLIEQGQFFISPSEACQYCPYTGICRKDSFRSVLRARHASLAKPLQEAKQ